MCVPHGSKIAWIASRAIVRGPKPRLLDSLYLDANGSRASSHSLDSRGAKAGRVLP
jgi:hypothetical protein